ncbi:MAG: hypothetical protein IJ191_06550 [Treponema sp.]|nr:hypothetical protein [Treponema sp.]
MCDGREFVDEYLENIEEFYQVTSASFVRIEDAFQFIEERVQVAKLRYDNNKCFHYTMEVEYDTYGCPKSFKDWYVFGKYEQEDIDDGIRFAYIKAKYVQ